MDCNNLITKEPDIHLYRFLTLCRETANKTNDEAILEFFKGGYTKNPIHLNYLCLLPLYCEEWQINDEYIRESNSGLQKMLQALQGWLACKAHLTDNVKYALPIQIIINSIKYSLKYFKDIETVETKYNHYMSAHFNKHKISNDIPTADANLINVMFT